MWDFNGAHEFGSIRIMLNGAAAHNHNPLAPSCEVREIAFHSFDDDGSRHSVQGLPVTLAMRMSVVPEQAGRVVGWNLNRVVQSLAGPRHHSDHVILWGIRRDAEPMKMQVRHVHARIDRTRLRGIGGKIVDVGDFENVTWRCTNHGGDRVPFERKGIPAIFIHRMQRKRCDVIPGSHLRSLRQEYRLGAT